MGQGPCTLALRASQSFEFIELTERVIIVTVIVKLKGPISFSRITEVEVHA